MDICEEAVLEYPTYKGRAFVCPQPRLEGQGIEVNPDFVALNFEHNPLQVEFVEVSGGCKLDDLVKKLRWYQQNQKQITIFIRDHLSELKGLALSGSTPLVLRVFIQRAKAGNLRRHLNGLQKLIIISLDRVSETLLDWQKWTLASEV